MPRGIVLQNADQMIVEMTEMLLNVKRQHKGTFSVRLLGVRCSNFQGDEERSQDSGQMDISKFISTCSPIRASHNSLVHSTGTTKMTSRIEKKVDFAQKGAQTDAQVKNTDISSFFSKEKGWNKVEEFETAQVLDSGTNSTHALHSVDPGNVSSVPASRDSIMANQSDSLVCPVCNVKFVEYDNDQFNRHIDACLNSSMVRNLVRQECIDSHKRPKKK
eukprot:CAMPEP_0198295986 /NCGR_PEP_ID=MMETSP1449-20131203/30383_1 /TAXON_ID=420275 /ORGANISM="Attheya septentrionalis, Strain CCMP2084" /LENGTH=217 /DNA_ID=CAMNT_0043996441 /DNA_START=184 /DNA_END=834 /DNA_ORIENTATION=+